MNNQPLQQADPGLLYMLLVLIVLFVTFSRI